MSPIPAPPWHFDSTDQHRYAAATIDGRCPADGTALLRASSCPLCRRVFDSRTGLRVSGTWHTGPGYDIPDIDELRALLVMMLRSASPHPVEHPTMWRAWGLACERLRLNPDDYRIPTRNKELEQRLMKGDD